MGKYIYRVILTPEEDGIGYSAEVPDLPGCYTFGDTGEEAIIMAADAAKTYVASLLKHGDPVPKPTITDAAMLVYFEVDESYVVDGEVVSAAEASRMLGVSAGRVTHMLDSGVLNGYRKGRRTYITLDSVNARLADTPKSGRPRKTAVTA